MKLNQKSNVTSYNRYPQIFREIKSIISNPSQILSFGCSTGLECNTLHKLYYPNKKIIGLDICKNIIETNKIRNKISNIKYTSDINEIENKSDLIFVMSVLCRWPEEHGEYTFETFEETLNIIDNLLNIDGYLCIYNSKYIFTETDLFNEKYQIVETEYKETGFVYKYHKDGIKLDYSYPYYLFKKIK